MSCKNHPDATAADRCTGCAEAFCENCLVEVRVLKYCGSCKVMVLQGQTVPLVGNTRPCPEAREALTLSIFSFFCFGFILGPLAIQKALKARKAIDADMRLTGSGKANAALLMGILALVFWVITMFGKAKHALN